MCKVCGKCNQKLCSRCKHATPFDARVRLGNPTIYANKNHGRLSVAEKSVTRVWRIRVRPQWESVK